LKEKGLSERSRSSWKSNTNTDLKEIGYEDVEWTHLDQERTGDELL
jgi:hypothetical protein